MEHTRITHLDNGLKVVSKNIENFNSVAMGYWVEAGGICETTTNCGVSHFLEHMAFKGTESRSAKQIAEEIESVGGYTNAYTSKEVTAFHAKVLKEDKFLALDILSDIIQNPTFLDEELKKEKGVILQEICQSFDTPDDIIFDHFQQYAFKNQSLGMPILGPSNIVSNMNSRDLRNYMQEYYNADNITFGIVGNIDHDEILEKGAKYFNKFSNKKTTPHDKKYIYESGFYSDIRDIEQVHTIIGFNGAAYLDSDYYIQAIFSSILGGGMSSKLFQEVREKRGLVYSIYSFASSFKKNGLFGVYAATTHDKLSELSDVVSTELVNMKHSVTEAELARTKTQFKASLLIANESNATSCEQIVSHSILFDRPIPNEEIIHKLDQISISDIISYADKILSSKPTVVTVGKCNCDCILRNVEKNLNCTF